MQEFASREVESQMIEARVSEGRRVVKRWRDGLMADSSDDVDARRPERHKAEVGRLHGKVGGRVVGTCGVEDGQGKPLRLHALQQLGQVGDDVCGNLLDMG